MHMCVYVNMCEGIYILRPEFDTIKFFLSCFSPLFFKDLPLNLKSTELARVAS